MVGRFREGSSLRSSARKQSFCSRPTPDIGLHPTQGLGWVKLGGTLGLKEGPLIPAVRKYG